ncbi:MAG: hypothetical protein JO166_02805 [Deltaproteobacteria bacterium]|nr:hypothetical protein [Deltaproteobacteria bacterium]
MNANARRFSTSAFRSWGLGVAAAMLAAVPLVLASPRPAEAANSPALRLIKLIPINANMINSFDISWFDRSTGLYYLGDRSNASVDVVDTTGAFTGTPDTLYTQIAGNAFHFAGDTGSTATSGPNGVTASPGGNCVFITDGPSRVVSVNTSNFLAPVSSMSTGGQFRADELAFDPADSLLFVVNNADSPPFATIFNVSPATCALTFQTKILFSEATIGLNATNGAEQPVWDPTTRHFYVSIPELNGPGGGGPVGGVAGFQPFGMFDKFFPITGCQPAGLSVGPNGDLLVGCNTVFDFEANACSAVVPSPSRPNTPAGAPARCPAYANPKTMICNPSKGCSAANGSLVEVDGVGGGDEVWFNSGDGNYYVTASNNPLGPSLGVIKSVTNVLTQILPTLPPTVALPGVHGSGTVHSVAASSLNNHVYVPLPGNTAYTTVQNGILIDDCAAGCIAVFSAE